MSKSLGNMIFVRNTLESTTPQALRLYLFDVHYRRPFDHDETRLLRARERASALASSLGRGPVGPLGRDAGTRTVLAALDDDLNAPRAIRALERAARAAPKSAKPSLRFVARRVLGIA
jgi:cysteinyl-tRNA synthetase